MLTSIFDRTFKIIGILALTAAVVLPQAQAATPKRAIVKKQQVTKVASSKKVITTRTRVRFDAKAQKPSARLIKAGKSRRPVRIMAFVPPRLSFGQLAGLHSAQDALDLKSSVALVMDQDTREVLFSKNEQVVLPIASLTKLMTGVVISAANLPMDQLVSVTEEDVDTEKGSRSRLKVGTELTRGELMHLSLMSSENRAAHALGRTYPGGMAAFVKAMNVKARLLGMNDTVYVEPTGLSSRNQSSARDLAALVNAAHADPMLRELSTSAGSEVAVGNRMLQFNNTNRLVKNPDWDIGLQKTGYISEAGQCLVMQTRIAGRKLIMVFLDSSGKLSRLGDAERVRRWVESVPTTEQKIQLTTSAKQNAG